MWDTPPIARRIRPRARWRSCIISPKQTVNDSRRTAGSCARGEREVRPFDSAQRLHMFDLVAKHKRIAQGILFLIMVPFAFFGVDYYFRGGAQQDTVATVGGEKITQNDYADAVREQTEQMRRQL